jgi:putative membrane protein
VTLVAALVMVGWDVAMDPGQSTLSGDWVWEQGGPYFGVPLHNYLGWFATVFAFLLVYGLWERRGPEPETLPIADERWLRAEPTIYFAIVALGLVLTPVLGLGPDSLAAADNYPGTVEELKESMSLVAVFTMGGPVAFALLGLTAARSSAAA